jgi:mRNA-degrading endonuclease toxin of MazEF toxin-antitoxin module
MTTKYNPKYSRFQMEIEDFKKYGLPVGSAIIINQIKIVSKSRLIRKKETARPLSKPFLKLVIEKALRFLR